MIWWTAQCYCSRDHLKCSYILHDYGTIFVNEMEIKELPVNQGDHMPDAKDVQLPPEEDIQIWDEHPNNIRHSTKHCKRPDSFGKIFTIFGSPPSIKENSVVHACRSHIHLDNVLQHSCTRDAQKCILFQLWNVSVAMEPWLLFDLYQCNYSGTQSRAKIKATIIVTWKNTCKPIWTRITLINLIQ